MRDRIVLAIKNEQTTEKLLRRRDLTLNQCIDVCRSEEVTQMKMKSLSEPVDSIHQVKSKGKKSETPSDGKLNMESKKISCKFCRHVHPLEKRKCPVWGKTCKKCRHTLLLLGSNNFLIYVPVDIKAKNLLTITSVTKETSDA